MSIRGRIADIVEPWLDRMDAWADRVETGPQGADRCPWVSPQFSDDRRCVKKVGHKGYCKTHIIRDPAPPGVRTWYGINWPELQR